MTASPLDASGVVRAVVEVLVRIIWIKMVITFVAFVAFTGWAIYMVLTRAHAGP